MPSLIPTEDEECYAFVEWLDSKRLMYTHVPNETYSASWSVKRRNKKLGVSRGVPDYLVIVNDHLVWIEMKRRDRKPKRGGKGGISDEQWRWIDALNRCENTQVYVTYGAKEAIEVIEKYLTI